MASLWRKEKCYNGLVDGQHYISFLRMVATISFWSLHCKAFNAEVDFGIDTLTIVFLWLAGFLMGIVVWIVICTLTQHQFYIILLCLIGFHLSFTFFSLNTILFFIGFEVILVLMYFLINNWGSKLYKIRSSFYLLLFTIFFTMYGLSYWSLSRLWYILPRTSLYNNMCCWNE